MYGIDDQDEAVPITCYILDLQILSSVSVSFAYHKRDNREDGVPSCIIQLSSSLFTSSLSMLFLLLVLSLMEVPY